MRKQTYSLALVPALFLALGIAGAAPSASAQVAVGISVHVGPPALPVYVQPACPVEGYLWTPGYWSYGAAGYYWVPGVWVAPPRAGLLWTPGYWGWGGGVYAFHAGYWGPHVGFYGGVNYGYGYGGAGFVGGEWRGGHFAYNTAVVNVNSTVVRNTYVNRTVVNTTVVNHTSFNGGPGGINATASAQERSYGSEQHVQATSAQAEHERTAGSDRSNWASENHGRPTNAAMSHVGERQENQQQRIGNGVKSGELTAGETKNLENRESNINHEVATDRRANGGTLTPDEKAQVNHQQNNVSKSIYDDKHNAATQPGANSEVGQRQENQQQRIGNGIKSGQMTAGEAARAENNEQHINQQVHADRQANGGHLTQSQKQQVNKEQNKESKQIHNEKHNDKTAHPK
jgi:WXXGXW repeat (2 copies)